MSTAVTGAAMILAARQRANQETLDATQALVSDTEALSHLNYMLAQIRRELVKARKNYFRKNPPQTITTVGGTDTYSLAADFMEAISVDWVFGSNEVYPVLPFEESERNMYKVIPGWYRNQPRAFQIQEGNIVFIPTPDAALTIKVNYVYGFTPLPTVNDTYASQFGEEDYAINKLAAFLCMKDQDEITGSYWDKEAEAKLQEIRSMANNRSGSPQRVQRVRKTRRLGQVY